MMVTIYKLLGTGIADLFLRGGELPRDGAKTSTLRTGMI